MTRTAPNWLLPIVAICTLQTVSSFLSRLIPIVAPAMAEEFQWSGSSIGYLNASNALGALIVLLAGSGLLKHIGGTRTLQLTLIVGVLSMVGFLYPSLSIALLVCLVMGMNVGAATPAGSEVLQRFSPPGMRNLIFSIKQAGVPLGGMVAGLLAPPIILLAGWRIALLVCGVIVLLPIVLTWRLSPMLDQKDGPNTSTTPWRPHLSFSALIGPLASLKYSSGLWRMSVVGSLFAVAQSCWFAFCVIFLIDRLDYSLATAGLVFAVMQIGGTLGRIALGWLSDYLQSATLTLSLTAILSAATTITLGFTNADWPLWLITLLAFIAGGSAASWNGVQLAEVARHSPPHLIGESSAGAAILVSLSNIIAPSAFAMAVAATGRYDLAFLGAGLCSLLVLFFLPRNQH